MKNFLKKFSKVGYFYIFKFGENFEVNVPLPMRWVDSEGGGLSIDSIEIEIRDIINILIGLGSVVAVAMIIVSGITLITSTGDPEKVEQGQRTLTGAIIGLVIVWVAGLIIKTILTALKV